MKGSISHIAITTLLALLSFAGFTQDKEELKRQRDKINEQISYTKKLISEAERDREATNQQLLILNKQISLRQRLIDNINLEIDDIEEDIQNKLQLIDDLEHDIDALKREYANMIYQSYKNRKAHDKLMYIFSSDDFNQAYKRLKMLGHYTEVRKKQAADIANAQVDLKTAVEELESIRDEKMVLANEKNAENQELSSDKQSREQTLASLQSREKELRKQQQKQEAERQRLNQAIQKIIEEELRAEKKKNSGKYELTPEGKIVSANFEKNKGSLPWPVDRGVITQKFGKQEHPTLPGIQIENNGIDITTDQEAAVRSIFEGTVTSLFSFPGTGFNVIITHGGYKSVYTNLKEVRVKKGDKVDASQQIGTVLSDKNKAVAHLEIWKITAEKGIPQNPEYWISKN